MNPLSWVYISFAKKAANDFAASLKILNAMYESWMHFIKLINYSKNVRNQSEIQVRWHNMGSSGAKMYHRGCCYWVWQFLIRITSSCCFQTEGKKFFLPTIEMKALRSAVYLLFHLLSSSKQLNAYDTLQWELHIHKSSCHRRFHAIT